MSLLIPVRIESRILTLRGVRVMKDADLAERYGVPTKALNQAVKRNLMHFETGQVSALTANAHHGCNQQTLEARVNQSSGVGLKDDVDHPKPQCATRPRYFSRHSVCSQRTGAA